MFQTRKELNRVFQTEGVFYRLKTKEGSVFCRSLAVIRRKGTEGEEADALFVLKNPGASMPYTADDGFPEASRGLSGLPTVPATPDFTQHQLMRLMERRDWNLVKVINLYDLQAGTKDSFRMKVKFVEEQGEDRHSIFSSERLPELKAHIGSARHVIAGWGTDSFIGETASHALAILSELGTVNGLPSPTPPYFYHPYPWIREKCIKWLDEMEAQLNEQTELI